MGEGGLENTTCRLSCYLDDMLHSVIGIIMIVSLPILSPKVFKGPFQEKEPDQKESWFVHSLTHSFNKDFMNSSGRQTLCSILETGDPKRTQSQPSTDLTVQCKNKH